MARVTLPHPDTRTEGRSTMFPQPSPSGTIFPSQWAIRTASGLNVALTSLVTFSRNFIRARLKDSRFSTISSWSCSVAVLNLTCDTHCG